MLFQLKLALENVLWKTKMKWCQASQHTTLCWCCSLMLSFIYLLLFSVSAILAPSAMITFSKNPSVGIAEEQMIALGGKEHDPNLSPVGSYQPLVLWYSLCLTFEKQWQIHVIVTILKNLLVRNNFTWILALVTCAFGNFKRICPVTSAYCAEMLFFKQWIHKNTCIWLLWGKVFPAYIPWRNFTLPVWILLCNCWWVWMMSFGLHLFYQVMSWILLRWMIWGGITGRWSVRAKKKIYLSHQLYLLASFTSSYGPLIHFNIFQGCQVVSVLFGPDRRRRIVKGYFDISSTSPAAQQNIVVYSSGGFRHNKDSHKCPLRNLIWF